MVRASFFSRAPLLRHLVVLTFTSITLWGADARAASDGLTISSNAYSQAGGPSCSATSGGLTLRAAVVRQSGVSPFLVFFNAAGTTSSAVGGNHTAFQDVSYHWSFGDTGVSGSGNWPYGSNAGHNSKNAATGAVAAHLYITRGADTSYPVTVTAYDGRNTASCSLGVHAYDASGPSGFPGSATACVASASMPIAGSGGCPAGASVMRQANLGAALSAAFGSGKRVLFRCGDRFGGSYTIGSNVRKASIGAYGSCENSTAGRPVFENSGGNTITFQPNNPTDIRISDIDFEDGTRSAMAIGNGGGLGETQITLYNLNCNGMDACYYMNQATQSGLIASVATEMNTRQGTFWNYARNNCANGSVSANCAAPFPNTRCAIASGGYCDVDYNAIIGNSLDGAGAPNTGAGIETIRISACRFCVISNNDIKNANNIGAVLKLHDGNTYSGQNSPWVGQYLEYIEVADNAFTGSSGGQLVEIASSNNLSDERNRYIVTERNLFHSTASTLNMIVSGTDMTVRNNVFYVTSGTVANAVQAAVRGIEPAPSGVEMYNNTCYARVRIGSCVLFATGGVGIGTPAHNSFAQNNLFYNGGANSATVVNAGSGNTVSGNTANSAANPLLMNGGGSFNLISDFQPTQHYSGGADVPVWYDALGAAWSPTWDLGALKP